MKRLALAVALLGLAFAADTASAQDKYPSKTVKIVVPYAPGGATDITSRLFGEQLKNILGQSFVVENKPGAFGIVAIEEMARSKPDGHTLYVGNVSTNAITPVLFQKKFSDQLREGRGVGLAARDLSVVPRHHDGELRRQERAGPRSPTPRRIPASCATPAPASAASRISTPRFSQGAPASR